MAIRARYLFKISLLSFYLITVKVFRLIKDSMIILDMVIHYSDWEQFNKYWKVIREIPVPEGVEFAYSFSSTKGYKTADEVDYFVVIRN